MSTHPLLSVRVLEVVDAARVPRLADADQPTGQEAVLRHDDEVGEEAGARLDHADLTVRHADQPARRRTHTRLVHLRDYSIQGLSRLFKAISTFFKAILAIKNTKSRA